MNLKVTATKAALDAARDAYSSAVADADAGGNILAESITLRTADQQAAVDAARAAFDAARDAYQAAIYESGQGVW